MGELVTSKRVLTDHENRTQAVYELERAQAAGGDVALAAWARTWGGALRDILVDPPISAPGFWPQAGEDEA